MPVSDYWSMTDDELIAICKKYRISRWSERSKHTLIVRIQKARSRILELIAEESAEEEISQSINAVIAAHVFDLSISNLCIKCNKMCEPYEMLDALLLEHANRVSVDFKCYVYF